MKKEFLNEEMTYVAPSMKVVEMNMERCILDVSGGASKDPMNEENEETVG